MIWLFDKIYTSFLIWRFKLLLLWNLIHIIFIIVVFHQYEYNYALVKQFFVSAFVYNNCINSVIILPQFPTATIKFLPHCIGLEMLDFLKLALNGSN